VRVRVGEHELRAVRGEAPRGVPAAERERRAAPLQQCQWVEPGEPIRLLAGGDEAEERSRRALLRRPDTGSREEHTNAEECEREAKPPHEPAPAPRSGSGSSPRIFRRTAPVRSEMML